MHTPCGPRGTRTRDLDSRSVRPGGSVQTRTAHLCPAEAAFSQMNYGPASGYATMCTPDGALPNEHRCGTVGTVAQSDRHARNPQPCCEQSAERASEAGRPADASPAVVWIRTTRSTHPRPCSRPQQSCPNRRIASTYQTGYSCVALPFCMVHTSPCAHPSPSACDETRSVASRRGRPYRYGCSRCHSTVDPGGS